tara:strand:+ start:229 stop:504 length:276 start_codon:yes stop_codon:yes gene_type:complete
MAGLPDSKIKALAKSDMDMILRNADRVSTFDLINAMNKSQLDSLRKKSGIKKGVSGYKSISGGLKSGGRAGLKGGGICKKGMNKKAIGRNS